MLAIFFVSASVFLRVTWFHGAIQFTLCPVRLLVRLLAGFSWLIELPVGPTGHKAGVHY